MKNHMQKLLLVLVVVALLLVAAFQTKKTDGVIINKNEIPLESLVTVESTEETVDYTSESIDFAVESTEETVESQEDILNKLTYRNVSGSMWVSTSLNMRSGPDVSFGRLLVLNTLDEVRLMQEYSNGWFKVKFNEYEGYVSGKYLVDNKDVIQSTLNKETTETVSDNDTVVEQSIHDNNEDTQTVPEDTSNNKPAHSSKYPISYSDETATIEITKEWFENAWCYAAHIVFSDYDRLGTTCGKGSYGGKETTSSAAGRMNAMFAVNGCYSAPELDYAVARDGVVYNDKVCYSPAVYNSNTGELLSAWETGGTSEITGVQLSTLVNEGKVTDTFCFGPPILINGEAKQSSDTSRAQRTFIGTNGNVGDIWIVVSDGRKNDGESSGLTYTEMAIYLQSKGCVFGVPLDGGGSSTMIWNGEVLNANKDQRKVVDFLYFK